MYIFCRVKNMFTRQVVTQNCHTLPLSLVNLLTNSSWIINLFLDVLYEAVSVSKLACQFSSFFVKNFVWTTLTLLLLYKEWSLCTNNILTLNEQCRVCACKINFVQTMLSLYKKYQLFVQKTTTLHKQNCHIERTMTCDCVKAKSILNKQCWVCTNNVNFLYMEFLHFAQITSINK